jgi:hypothetical protein
VHLVENALWDRGCLGSQLIFALQLMLLISQHR